MPNDGITNQIRISNVKEPSPVILWGCLLRGLGFGNWDIIRPLALVIGHFLELTMPPERQDYSIYEHIEQRHDASRIYENDWPNRSRLSLGGGCDSARPCCRKRNHSGRADRLRRARYRGCRKCPLHHARAGPTGNPG